MRVMKILVVAVAAAVITAGVILKISSSDKDVGPQLQCTAGDAIEAAIGVTDEELLRYVTAYDEQDGDLSDQIKVIRKKYFIAKNVSVVRFVVSDSDNNVAAVKKKIVYTDYEPPVISLRSDFIFQAGNSYNLSNYVTASDMIDGDLTSSVKLISTEFSSIPGTYPVNIRVTNSMGDVAEITINALVTAQEYFNTKIQLDRYLVFVTPGTEPDYASYITGIFDRNDNRYDVKDIQIDASGVNLSEPGTYDMYYRLNDRAGNTITLTRLIVIVRET